MKHAPFLAVAALAALCAIGPALAQTTPPPAPAPAPSAVSTLAPIGAGQPALTPPALPTPAALPSITPSPPGGKKGKSKGSAGPSPSPPPSETPSPPAFKSLDGDWEFVESTLTDDIYPHMIIKQEGQALTGTWRIEKKNYPAEGTFDGKSIKLTVQRDGKPWTFLGYVDSASDMVGRMTDPDGKSITFTANHRAPSKQQLRIRP